MSGFFVPAEQLAAERKAKLAKPRTWPAVRRGGAGPPLFHAPAIGYTGRAPAIGSV